MKISNIAELDKDEIDEKVLNLFGSSKLMSLL